MFTGFRGSSWALHGVWPAALQDAAHQLRGLLPTQIGDGGAWLPLVLRETSQSHEVGLLTSVAAESPQTPLSQQHRSLHQ